MRGAFSAGYIALRIPCIASHDFCASPSLPRIAPFAPRSLLLAPRIAASAARLLHPASLGKTTEMISLLLIVTEN